MSTSAMPTIGVQFTLVNHCEAKLCALFNKKLVNLFNVHKPRLPVGQEHMM
ncbi:hypothetical protein T4D_7040 [Trichinella pseudospiralis]|uniref:Uncharacterized protein n=1 Tax=Trichinella pseudospiralis TaxID=6337 RepID=A0A0V1F0R5_TRIPS|nr:hypothetical protein T4D_7040 [Trichinella pseudospiralis]